MKVKVTGMITEIEWKTGLPEEEGDYVTISRNGTVSTTHWSENGWNTWSFAKDHRIEDDYFRFWTADFVGIDKYVKP